MEIRDAHRAGEAAAGRPVGATELVCRLFIPGDPADGVQLARAMFSAYASVPVYAALRAALR